MELATVRVAVQHFHTARARAQVATHAGRSANTLSFDLKQTPFAADPESLALVRQDLAGASGRRETRLRLLENRLVRNIAQARCARTLEARHIALGKTVQGTEDRAHLPVHSLLDALSHTSDRAERVRLAATAASMSDPLYAAWAQQIDAAQAAGLDLSGAASDARTLLASTEAMYAEVLSWWLRRSVNLKSFPRGAEAHDVLWALSSLPFDALVRPGDVTALRASFAPLGAGAAMTFDTSAREDRRPGAFVSAPDAPGEVLVSHRAQGGFDDARAMLEALGTASHWAGADPDAPPEDRLMGDPAIRAATGKAWAMLLLDKPWSKKRLGVEDPDFTRVLALSDLARARLEAALIVGTYEAIQSGASPSQLSVLAESVSHATLGEWTPGLVSFALPDPFDAAAPLVARLLGLSLFEGVRERCDEDWWANPRSKSVLASFFEPGALFEPAALAEHCGLTPPSFVRIENVWAPSLD